MHLVEDNVAEFAGEIQASNQPVQQAATISLILPAWNEAEVIADAVAEADAALSQVTSGYEIIVVDDGSTDQTAEIVLDLAATNDRVRLVRHSATATTCFAGVAFVMFVIFSTSELTIVLFRWAILWATLLMTSLLLMADRYQAKIAWGTSTGVAFLFAVMVLELKSFIQPAEPRGLTDRSKEIKMGIDQATKLRKFAAEFRSDFDKLLGVSPTYRICFAGANNPYSTGKTSKLTVVAPARPVRMTRAIGYSISWPGSSPV